MKTDHTPGPWRLSERIRDAVVYDSDSGHDMHDAVTYYGGHLIAESIFREADRRLIAASPLLLDALKEIVAAADGKGWAQLDPHLGKARAAISAAAD